MEVAVFILFGHPIQETRIVLWALQAKFTTFLE